MLILNLLILALSIYTLVHMWKRLPIKNVFKVLIAILVVLLNEIFGIILIIGWWAYYFTKKPEILPQYVKVESNAAPATDSDTGNNTAQETTTETADSAADNNTQNTIPPKKEFFIKRWMRQLVNWIDVEYFSSEEDWESPFKALGQVFITCLITGILWWGNMIITNNSQNDFGIAMEAIAGAIMLIVFVIYILKDLPRFKSVGAKIGRGFYIFFLFAISAALALFLAMVLVGLFIIYLIFQIFMMMIFGDGKRYKLSNGDIVERDNGIFGGGNDQYRSTGFLSSKTYTKDGNKFYEND